MTGISADRDPQSSHAHKCRHLGLWTHPASFEPKKLRKTITVVSVVLSAEKRPFKPTAIFYSNFHLKLLNMGKGPMDEQRGTGGRNSPPPSYSPPGQYPPVQAPYGKAAPSAPPPPGLMTSNTGQGEPIQQQPTPMIIYSNPSATQFGPYPMRFTCPNCNAHVMTETHSTPGLLTWILSGAICCLAGYLLCCCLVPCCVRECKDVEHICPNCQHKLGLFKRI